MQHWQMRAKYLHPTTGVVIGYGRPRTFWPVVAQSMIKRSPGEWEVISTDFEVTDDPRAVVYAGPAVGISEVTDAGRAYLESQGLTVDGEGKVKTWSMGDKPIPGVTVKSEWKQEGTHAPVSVADAKKAAPASGFDKK